ncbi:hypothetical protein BDW59DRAFT_69235 [Aspergillus cavernicola]|uniref:Zn(2)-C6 fungal-type domain-containing protein n=1 Tax=Aspergillus cavernicola TaxID=176166 RepID=A0ABR4IE20_9EURO
MSSTYYIGPFGRMLPDTDGPAEQEPDCPANLSVTGPHPYQLPPPRTLAPLQFGTDPFLRPRNRSERVDEGDEFSGYFRGSGYKQANEQLPSVSQLLTPTAQSSRSPSPYHPSAFGIYLPSNDVGEAPERLRHNDSGTFPSEGRSEMYESSRPPLVSTPPLQTQNLPPISHISAHALGREGQAYLALSNTSHSAYSPGLSRRQSGEPNDGKHAAIPPMGTADSGPFGVDKPAKTQVRPHVVDERYITGEGLCYIYADGSHCPKSIDGIHVNANWGITKAGKPRKRLAQACLTCREKKIKCHPNLPKCDQCQKSGRECRFESAPRGHRAASRTSQWQSQFARKYDMRDSSAMGSSNNAGTSSSLYSIARASESSTSLPGTNSQSPLSDGSMLTPSAVDSNHESVTDYDQQYAIRSQRVSGTHEIMPRYSLPADSVGSPSTADYAEVLMEIKDLDAGDPLANDWRADPYAAEPELAIYLIEAYFAFVNDGLYYLFPRGRFLLWLKSCHTKSLDDNMLLYSMMTLGSVFSDRPDRMVALKRYSRTARYALEHSQHSLSLQLAQSRIIMSLWYYAIGALVKSWDAAGAAVRTVCGLRYNVEMGGVIVEQSQSCEYGLHPQALVECRRRTFWVAFLMDRLSCFYAPSTTSISSQTAFLRLPCREEIYEAQEYTSVPFFQSFLNERPVSQDDQLSSLSAMALLIDVISIWGDVSDHVFRMSLIPADSYNKLFEEFYGTMVRRSDQWLSRLPNHLTFIAVNLERSIRGRKIDPFISIHLLYHATLLKLNRYARSQLLRSGVAKQYVHTARNHAAEILRTALALVRYASEYDASQMVTDLVAPKGTLLSPFLGYVILSAVDVLSAGGLMIDLPECINLIRGGLEVVRQLSSFWASTKPLVSLIETRLEAMIEAHHHLTSEGKVAFILDGPSLDSQIHNGVQKQDSSTNEDLLYGGLPHEQLFGAFGLVDAPYSLEDIFWIRTGG